MHCHATSGREDRNPARPFLKRPKKPASNLHRGQSCALVQAAACTASLSHVPGSAPEAAQRCNGTKQTSRAKAGMAPPEQQRSNAPALVSPNFRSRIRSGSRVTRFPTTTNSPHGDRVTPRCGLGGAEAAGQPESNAATSLVTNVCLAEATTSGKPSATILLSHQGQTRRPGCERSPAHECNHCSTVKAHECTQETQRCVPFPPAGPQRVQPVAVFGARERLLSQAHFSKADYACGRKQGDGYVTGAIF